MFCFSILWTFILITGVRRRTCTLHTLDSIRSYEVITPTQHGTTYSGHISTRVSNNEHLEKTIIEFSAFSRTFRIHLFKNNILLPPNFKITYQFANRTSFDDKRVENCYYQGFIHDDTRSSVAISTCSGLRGIIKDGKGEEFIIEPFLPKNRTSYRTKSYHTYPVQHIIYRGTDVITKDRHTCGVYGTNNSDHVFYRGKDAIWSNGLPRNSKKVNINGKKYIEVLVVVDHREHATFGADTANHALTIMLHVDTIYKVMNTRIAVRELIIWVGRDKIKVTDSAGHTLTEFEKYVKNVLYPDDIRADTALLLTGISFSGSLVGLAGVGTMCSISSASVVEDYSPTHTFQVANTVAHEVGHNVGFRHNSGRCNCPKVCVMDAGAPNVPATSWTDCVRKEYNKRLSTGELTCLFDYPDKLYGKPKCGNGFLEKGEDCDCGSEEECKATGDGKCCNPKTCKLQPSAKCTSGPCCEDCQPRDLGYLCREAFDAECDVTEYCPGDSVLCPKNTYRQDGTSCDSGTGSCYQGSCKSHNLQCQTLWGPNAVKGYDYCYKENTRVNDAFANCGWEKEKPIPCNKENVLCGKLQCMSRSTSVELPNVPIIGEGTKQAKMLITGKAPYCKMAYIHFDKDQEDPSMALSGTKCGKTSICDNRKCRNVSDLAWITSCKTKCLNGGVCNNYGNCHCPPGYACPTCEFAGPGGSYDSGQGCTEQATCGCLTLASKLLIIIILCIIVNAGLISYFVVLKRHTIIKAWHDYLDKGKKARGENVKKRHTLRHHGNVEVQNNTGVSSYNNQATVAFGIPENKQKTPHKKDTKQPSKPRNNKGDKITKSQPAAISSSNTGLTLNKEAVQSSENTKSNNVFSKTKKLFVKSKNGGVPTREGRDQQDSTHNPGTKVDAFNKMDQDAGKISKDKRSPPKYKGGKSGPQRVVESKPKRLKTELTRIEDSPPKSSDIAYINTDIPMNRRSSAAQTKQYSKGGIVFGNIPAIKEVSPREQAKVIITDNIRPDRIDNKDERNIPKQSPKPGRLAQIDAYNKMDKVAGNIPQDDKEVTGSKLKGR